MRQQRETRKIELVETHNLARSLARLTDNGPYDTERWKRALYHALLMNGTSKSTTEKIRIALELP